MSAAWKVVVKTLRKELSGSEREQLEIGLGFVGEGLSRLLVPAVLVVAVVVAGVWGGLARRRQLPEVRGQRGQRLAGGRFRRQVLRPQEQARDSGVAGADVLDGSAHRAIAHRGGHRVVVLEEGHPKS